MIERAESVREMTPILDPLADDDTAVEIYRQLYASLDLSPDGDQVIALASAIPGEGTSTIALGLARTLAEDVTSAVTLVEANFARPSLAQRLGLPASPGLADVLREEQRIGDVLIPAMTNLSVVPAGDARSSTGNLLYQLVHQLAVTPPFGGSHGLRGLVILDLPPILGHGYSRLAARLADALLLVVRAEVTPINVVQEAVQTLENPPRGVILNATQAKRRRRR